MLSFFCSTKFYVSAVYVTPLMYNDSFLPFLLFFFLEHTVMKAAQLEKQCTLLLVMALFRLSATITRCFIFSLPAVVPLIKLAAALALLLPTISPFFLFLFLLVPRPLFGSCFHSVKKNCCLTHLQ